MTSSVKLLEGDSRQLVKTLPDSSVDAIITDPPYELNFMNRKWDNSGIAYDVELWKDCLNVLKPGGHLLAFGGTRTYHRLACAIEDAGFEIRDSIHWIYGSGFPKSLNVSKAIDKAPNTDAARWEGWGTALKPAHEPIVLARKPLAEKTVAANVIEYGTGAININACRVGNEIVSTHSRGQNTAFPKRPGETTVQESGRSQRQDIVDQSERPGRWPSNILLSDAVAEELDSQTGDIKSTQSKIDKPFKRQDNNIYGKGLGSISPGNTYADSGGASKFFPVFKYQSKANKKERAFSSGVHPTVKPVALIEWLTELVSKPGDTVLDPFAGSGTTGLACINKNRNVILIENDSTYCDIIMEKLNN